MASSSRSLPVSESESSENSSDSNRETIFQFHQKQMKTILGMFTPDVIKALCQPPKRRYIRRNREETTQQLFKDYFTKNPVFLLEYFHKRFRMRQELFLRIMNDVEAYDNFFKQKLDVTGRMGCMPIQKMTTAIRILAYGISADLCDEYIKVGECTAIKSLKRFYDAVIALYAKQYIRSPNKDDIARLLEEGKERGFPGMLGSMDYMHWEWRHGTHKGRSGKPTLILEAVA